jgi:hypothetical protein
MKTRFQTTLFLALSAPLLATAAPAQSCTAISAEVIGGQHNPFLAGQPAGTQYSSTGDFAPAQSPFLLPLSAGGGDVFRFVDVAGDVSSNSISTGPGPEGNAIFLVSSGAALGIAGLYMPQDAFLGVFLPDVVNSGAAPAKLDFSTTALRDFTSLSPELYQPFFIGDGLRDDGVTLQEFHAPAGATRLFLGSCDSLGWYNNSGSFTFTVERDGPCVRTYCTAGTTSNGCQAAMSASGSPSAAAPSGFTLDVTGVEGNKQGILFYGINGPKASPWGAGSSYLCVQGPVQRMGTLPSGGTNGQCNGHYSLDWLAWMAARPGAKGNPLTAGETFWAQAWFRDPPSPQTTNLSDGLEFTLLP